MTSISNERPAGLRELLAFYAQAGVDDALADEPLDRFAESQKARSSPPSLPSPRAIEGLVAAASINPADAGASSPARFSTAATASRQQSITAVPDDTQIALARQRAGTAATLDELRQQLAEFDGCNLKFTAKNLVFADGNPEAQVMLVGEAPGRDEDMEGLPFVGRSGQLLDRILAAIGLDRQSAYIANVIPWRPPGNRTPTPQETEICRPFIERQIELVNPRLLITLGGPSAKLILGASEGILRLRGSWRSHTTASGVTIPAMPTLHPAYLLRNPAHKKLAWRDFLEVKARLRELG